MTWTIILGAFLAGTLAVLLWEYRQRTIFRQNQEEMKRIGEKVESIAAVVEVLQKEIGQTLSTTLQILQAQDKNLSDRLTAMQMEIGQNLSTTVQILRGQDKNLSDRLSAVQGLVADLRERLGKVEEISRRVGEVAQDLAELQTILQGPKARGALGEWILSELLADVLPREKFKEQYRFRDGSVVDAAIFLEEAIVPVDAKFPVANFEALRSASTAEERKKLKKNLIRDAQKHADTIAQKYIKPEEGTTDFALMYIPAEGVFLELLLPEDDLNFMEYAWRRNVFPCSPNSFYLLLRLISKSFRDQELVRNIKAVLGGLQSAEYELKELMRDFDILGGHLRNAYNKWFETSRKLEQLQNQISRVAQKEAE